MCKLRPGMLLLEPGPNPKVWVADSARTLLHYANGVTDTMLLRRDIIPEGWKRIMGDAVALALERGKHDENEPYLEDD